MKHLLILAGLFLVLASQTIYAQPNVLQDDILRIANEANGSSPITITRNINLDNTPGATLCILASSPSQMIEIYDQDMALIQTEETTDATEIPIEGVGESNTTTIYITYTFVTEIIYIHWQ